MAKANRSLGPAGKLECFGYLLRRPLTTTVLRCPLEVSFARRFLTSSSALRWVENESNRSPRTPTDQPLRIRSTTKIVVIACVATNERSTDRADQRVAVWAGRALGAFATILPVNARGREALH